MLAISERTAVTGSVHLFSAEETVAAKQATAEKASGSLSSGNISGAIPQVIKDRELAGKLQRPVLDAELFATGKGALTSGVEHILADSEQVTMDEFACAPIQDESPRARKRKSSVHAASDPSPKRRDFPPPPPPWKWRPKTAAWSWLGVSLTTQAIFQSRPPSQPP